MLWLLTLFHCLPGVREHVLSPVTWLGVLALHSVGKATGMAVDCGDGATQVVPIWQGKSMMHAVQRIDLAGRELNEYMYGSLVLLTSLSFFFICDSLIVSYLNTRNLCLLLFLVMCLSQCVAPL